VIVAIAIAHVPFGGRVIRAVVLSLKEMSFVEAARGLGASHLRMMIRHILPQCVAPHLILATTHLGVAIIIEAALGFSRRRHPAADPDLGQHAGGFIERRAGAALVAGAVPRRRNRPTVLAFNLLGDGIRDILEPRLRRAVWAARLRGLAGRFVQVSPAWHHPIPPPSSGPARRVARPFRDHLSKVRGWLPRLRRIRPAGPPISRAHARERRASRRRPRSRRRASPGSSRRAARESDPLASAGWSVAAR
jgi:hypothetical protein